MELVIPSDRFEKQYLEAINEAEKESLATTLSKPKENQSFADFVKEINDQTKGIYQIPGHVPATTFWLIDNDGFIGRVQIRHILNDYLFKFGGHIGYYIRPSKRQSGYGKKILELVLPKGKELGLKKVLVTCDEDNIGSRKIIEANGGVFENSLPQGEGKPNKLRFWINIK